MDLHSQMRPLSEILGGRHFIDIVHPLFCCVSSFYRGCSPPQNHFSTIKWGPPCSAPNSQGDHTHIYIYIFDIYTYRSSSGWSLGKSKHPRNQIPLHSPRCLRQRCQRCFPPRCKAVSPQDDRRKFRSQTSDNMDRWKAEMGRVREEKRRRKKIKKEKVSEERRSGCAKG